MWYEDDDPEDQVVRRHRVEAAHPEWQIISPASPRGRLMDQVGWKASRPDGVTIHANELRDLLDDIERRSGRDRSR